MIRSMIAFVLLFAAFAAMPLLNAQDPQIMEKAKKGDARAQYKLFEYYQAEYEKKIKDKNVNEKAAEKLNAESEKWLRKAAEQGYAKAQYELFRYIEGIKTDFDWQKFSDEGLKWLRKAAERGLADAQF